MKKNKTEERRPNIRLLKKTLRFIEKNPERWDQGTWCGTNMCFAGWACSLSGFRHEHPLVEALKAVSVDPTTLHDTVTDGGSVGYAFDVAKNLLGLPDRVELFNGSNDLEDLRLGVSEIVRMERNRRARERWAQRKATR